GRRYRGCRAAGSRNEICVTRGPTSPRLAPPLLSSVQLDAVPVSAPGRVAERYIIQLCHSSYTGATKGPFSREERETKGRSSLRGSLPRPRGSHYEIVVTRLISTPPRELS
ncbi:hypothetical protein WH47_12010, partial [Habropoda laboriosa]